MISLRFFILAFISFMSAFAGIAQEKPDQKGSVIFFHPDGTGLNHWNALRIYSPGPDGALNWDKLPAMAIYKGHMLDSMVATSHGGATVHAYGVKVPFDSFGMAGSEPLLSASGKPLSILMEAKAAGKSVGILNSGHIAEPGSAVFAASVQSRRAVCEIAKQVALSGADVIMSGGEQLLLPIGTQGYHGRGSCVENIIEQVKAKGYTVVYTKAELQKLADNKFEGITKLFGAFAADDTFNDDTEENNKKNGLTDYNDNAPTIKEMSEAALAILSRSPNGFFLVAEEEGTDNFSNHNNAKGQFEALKHADDAIGMFRTFIAKNPNTLFIMAADSEAGGLSIVSSNRWSSTAPLPEKDHNGAPLDGVEGTQTPAFLSAPDANGKRWPFAVAWATLQDTAGSVLVRGEGLNSSRITSVMDNTDVYKVMYLTLFGTQVSQTAMTK